MKENMQDIRRRIRSVESMEQITNAMKLVSAAKLRKAKSAFDKNRENSYLITEAIEEIFYNSEDVPVQYLRGTRKIKRAVYIVLSSSRGLCGSFNSNVIKHTQAVIHSYPEEEKPYIVAVGDKVRDHFSQRGYTILSDYSLAPEEITFQESRDISKPLVDLYDAGEVDEVWLIHTHFVNSLHQEVRSVALLPFTISDDPYEHKIHKEIEYEPSVEAVFNYLVPKYVETMIYSAIVESATCEHAARRMAMESATDNARDMIDQLNLSYNRSRQAAITNEISEIVGGAEVLG